MLLSQSVYVIIAHGKKCLAYYQKKNSTLLSYPECLRYYGSPITWAIEQNLHKKILYLTIGRSSGAYS